MKELLLKYKRSKQETLVVGAKIARPSMSGSRVCNDPEHIWATTQMPRVLQNSGIRVGVDDPEDDHARQNWHLCNHVVATSQRQHLAEVGSISVIITLLAHIVYAAAQRISPS